MQEHLSREKVQKESMLSLCEFACASMHDPAIAKERRREDKREHKDSELWTAVMLSLCCFSCAQCKTCATAEERRRREEREQQRLQEAAPAKAKVKKCSRCGADKPASDYCRNKRSFDGLYSQCRTCVSEKVPHMVPCTSSALKRAALNPLLALCSWLLVKLFACTAAAVEMHQFDLASLYL